MHRSLTSIAVRLLLEGRVKSVDRLLLVTFTRAATDELKDKLGPNLDIFLTEARYR